MKDRQYDVFLSLAGCDRKPVRRLVAALRAADLKVFIDEDDIRHSVGVTAEIEAALRSAKTLLVYYSAAFAGRSACQFELTAAFLAGQQEGDPSRRIIVVNPEEETDHLHPVELSDARFELMPAPRDAKSMAATVSRIRTRVQALSGAIGGVAFTDRPPWYAERVPGSFGFVGRYHELWRLHSALRGADFSLTQNVTSGPVAALVGMPGIGKTAVAASYAWQFGAAHLGGVYWISLAGAGPTGGEVLARLGNEVRAVAEMLGLGVEKAGRGEVLVTFADRLAARDAPSLLVIDDVPADLDPAVVNGLVIPGGNRVRTVLITHGTRYGDVMPTVEVGPMSADDGSALLRRYREAETPEEVAALEQLVDRLGGHAHALNLAGHELRERHGFSNYASFLGRLGRDETVLAPVTAMIRDTVSALDPVQRLVLQMSLVCSPAALPARFIQQVVTALRPAVARSPGTIGSAVVGLRDRLLASRIDAAWHVHPVVRDATRDHVEPVLPVVDIARAAADTVLALAGLADVDPRERALLMQHSGALAVRTDLPTNLVERLLRQLTAYYQMRGEPLLGAPFHEQLVARHPDSPADLIAAAHAHHHSGHHEAAIGYAEKAVDLAGDDAVRYEGRRLMAEAMDALGRHADATRLWTQLLERADEPPVGAPEHLATRIAQLRGLRMRGATAAAERQLKELLAGYERRPGDDCFDELQAAYLELAQVQLMTDDQRAARGTAAAVLRRYQERGLPNHRQALWAQQVFADAQLALPLWELRPDPATWHQAEESLRQLSDGYRRTHGRRNMFTLTAVVAHGQALVSLGESKRAQERLGTVIPDIVEICGHGHPLELQASFLLGQAYAQLGDYQRARDLYSTAYDGQRATLGPNHPQTLHTQFQLGVALRMTSDGARAEEMFRAVRKAAPHSVGANTNLFAQATVAVVLTKLPTWVWRAIGRPDARPDKGVS